MIRILQLTDFHVFSDATQRLKGIDTNSCLEKVVQYILDSGVEFDHVVVTGDHTHDELPESYRFVKSQLQRLADRWWQVPGNHDDRRVLRSVFPKVQGSGDEQVRFCFDAETWTCIGLDSHVPGLVEGRIEISQVDWLKSKLSESSAQHVALFLHHPPVIVESEWMDQIGLEGRKFLADIVETDRRIQLVVCGHVHHDFRSQLHQATVFASPSTGIQFDPRGTTPTFADDAPGYRMIELSQDGWKTEVVRVPDAAGTLERQN